MSISKFPIRGFPKDRDTFLGVPIIRNIVFWVLHWGARTADILLIRAYRLVQV